MYTDVRPLLELVFIEDEYFKYFQFPYVCK